MRMRMDSPRTDGPLFYRPEGGPFSAHRCCPSTADLRLLPVVVCRRFDGDDSCHHLPPSHLRPPFLRSPTANLFFFNGPRLMTSLPCPVSRDRVLHSLLLTSILVCISSTRAPCTLGPASKASALLIQCQMHRSH